MLWGLIKLEKVCVCIEYCLLFISQGTKQQMIGRKSREPMCFLQQNNEILPSVLFQHIHSYVCSVLP